MGLAIAHEQGIKAVTMTSVAARLDVATPALYHYVSGHEELLGLLGSSLLEPVVVAGGRRPALDRVVVRVLARDPRPGHRRAHARGGSAPQRARAPQHPDLERGVEVLTNAGFDAHDAFLHTSNIVATVFTSVYREHCTEQERAGGAVAAS